MDPKAIAGEKMKKDRPSYSVIPVRALRGVMHAFRNGADKYGRLNWRNTRKTLASLYFDAAMDHMSSWWEGEDNAKDSGLNHIDHAIAGLLILRDSMLDGGFDDDRPLPLDASTGGGGTGETGSGGSVGVVDFRGRKLSPSYREAYPEMYSRNQYTNIYAREGTSRRVAMWQVPSNFMPGISGTVSLDAVLREAPPWVRKRREQFKLTSDGRLMKQTRLGSENWKIVNGRVVFTYLRKRSSTEPGEPEIIAYKPDNFHKYYELVERVIEEEDSPIVTTVKEGPTHADWPHRV